MARGVGRLLVAEDERVACIQPLARERDAPAQVADGVVGLRRVDRLEPERAPEAAQKGRVGRERARATRGARESSAPAAGRPNHLSVITLKRSPSSRPHHLARPRLARRARCARPRARAAAAAAAGCQARKNASVSVTRSSAPPAIRRTASPRQTWVSEKVRPSTSIPSQRSTSSRGQLRVAARVGPAGQPPAVVAPLGGSQRRVGEDVLVAHLLAAAERLEDRAARELVGPVAQHRPVRDLARRRAPGADGVEQPARARAPRARRGSASQRPRCRCGRRAPRAPGRRARRAGRRRSDTRRGG